MSDVHRTPRRRRRRARTKCHVSHSPIVPFAPREFRARPGHRAARLSTLAARCARGDNLPSRVSRPARRRTRATPSRTRRRHRGRIASASTRIARHRALSRPRARDRASARWIRTTKKCLRRTRRRGRRGMRAGRRDRDEMTPRPRVSPWCSRRPRGWMPSMASERRRRRW